MMKNKGKNFENLIMKSLKVVSGFVLFKSHTPSRTINGKNRYVDNAIGDVIGCFLGKFILIEAKETSLEYLPYKNIRRSQEATMKKISDSGGLSIFIINFNNSGVVGVLNIDEYLKMKVSQKKINVSNTKKYGYLTTLDNQGLINFKNLFYRKQEAR